MASIELTSTNFDEVVGGNPFVIVDYWAEWCGPCKSFAPIFEQASEKYPDLIFAKVDTEQQQELASHFQIRSIPTLMIFRDQIVIFSQAGMLPADAFNQLIEKAMELDMDQVRAEIEKQQSAEQA